MKKLLLLLCAILLAACVSDIKFDTPQPEDRPDEESIPKKLWGIYRSAQDSSLLRVSPDKLVRYINRRFVVPKTLLDSAYVINGDTSFVDTENKLIVRVAGDSVYGRFRYLDTLFDISQINVLRKFKGYYFLNKQVGSHDWNLFLMTYGRNELELVTRWSDKEIAALREITHGKSDSRDFKPSRREMAKFIMKMGSLDGERLLRIYSGDSQQEWERLTAIEPLIVKHQLPL
jgi:hypothetical protein